MTNHSTVAPWPVATQRLVIRPAEASDVDAAWGHRRLPQVGEWITGYPTAYDEFAEAFVTPFRLSKTLMVELDGAVIGDLVLMVGDGWAQTEVADGAKGVQAELGWTLHPDFGGRGYATEAVRALISVCFAELGIRRVVASCFADNTASWRLMERVGMRREAHAVRDSLHRSGRWLDRYWYAVLAEEWPARD